MKIKVWHSFIILILLSMSGLLFFTFSQIDTSSKALTNYNKIITSLKKTETAQTDEIPPKESNRPITIAFTGDILLDRSVGELIKINGVNYPFAKVSDLLKNADLTAGNLETSVSLRGTPDDKQFTFRSKPETLKGLVNAGYDMVSLANNHTLDYGYEALSDTLDNLKKYGIGYSGAGSNQDEAFKSYVTEINGKKVAIIGLSRVLPTPDWFAREDKAGLAHAYQYEPMLSYVKNTVEESDYTIVMIHWNRERMDYPEDYAREMARKFEEIGVNAVIGGHSHSLMGIEFINDMPVYYSLGNFVFTDSSSPKGHETMIVYVTLSENKVETKLVPAKLINGQPTIMDESYNTYIRNKITDLSYNAHVQKDGTVENTDKQ